MLGCESGRAGGFLPSRVCSGRVEPTPAAMVEPRGRIGSSPRLLAVLMTEKRVCAPDLPE